MMHSMTAFGRAIGDSGDAAVSVEIKSVNSRYLDVSFRLPRFLSFLEEKIKAYLEANVITRGKVEVSITYTSRAVSDRTVALNAAYADAYVLALKNLRDRCSLPDDITTMSVARNPDVFTSLSREVDPADIWERILPVLEEAGKAHRAMRIAEGEKTKADLFAKLEQIALWVDEIETLSKADTGAYRDRLESRIRAILADNKVTVDENRLLTECAIWADKIAIDEELTRLRAHFGAFREIAEEPTPSGKKLDFLMQEMNRETNTIGSKCCDAQIARLVVNIKNELEKIREQVQNIE